MHKIEWIQDRSSNMLFVSLNTEVEFYPWFIGPPTYGILPPPLPISMEYRTPVYGILTPYPWYIEPPTLLYNKLSAYDILTLYSRCYKPPTHIPIAYQTPCLWYFDFLPMVHVYRTVSLWYIKPLSMIYLWYFDPLPMVYWNSLSMVLAPYPWYIEPPTNCISNFLPMIFWPSTYGTASVA
jgi:hypothetical protein